MHTSLEKAIAARQAYFDGLPPEQRARALAYQASLDKEAAETPGGMMEVIEKRLKHLTYSLNDALHAAHEECVNHEIRRIARG